MTMNSIEIRVFTQDYVESLLGKARVTGFVDYSNTSEFKFENNFAIGSSNVYLDLDIIATLEFNSEKPEGAPLNWIAIEDRKNSQIFYEAIYFLEDNGTKRPLTPLEASDRRMWTYLSHSIMWEYMQIRWGDGDVESRYFMPGNRNNLSFGKLTRHGISRLWWYTYLTYDFAASDPYHLLDTLFCNSDLTMYVIDSQLCHNRKVLKALLIFFSKNKKYQKGGDGNAMRFIMSSLNADAGVINLSILSEAELISRIEHFAKNSPIK